ncbi:MAG: LamG domain-containing protein [Phycisphaerae bacterium]
MTHLMVHLGLATLLTILAFGERAAAAEDEGSAPSPPEKVQSATEAETAFQQLYGQDVRRAEATADPKDDVALAAELVKAAKTITGQPHFLALVCEKACELGAAHPTGYHTALEAADLLAEHVPEQLNVLEETLLPVRRWEYERARGLAKAEAGEALIASLLAVAGTRADGLELDEALRLCREASSVARPIRSTQLRLIEQAQKRFTEMKRTLGQVQRLKDVLANDAENQVTRRKIVELFLMGLDNPAEAAKYVDGLEDKALRRYVPAAAKGVEAAPELACIEMGDWYREVAAGVKEWAKATLLKRARAYYARFLDLHEAEDLQRTKAMLAIKKVDAALSELGGGPPLPRGAVLALTFDRGTCVRKGGKVYVMDLSGKGNHGLVHGAKLARGPAGDALRFDGEDDYVDLGNSPSLQITGSQTIALWLKPSRLAARQNPYAKAYGGEGTMTLEPSGTVNYYYGRGGGNKRPYMGLGMTDSLTTDTWAHLVLVRDLSKKKVIWYKNGKKTNEGKARYESASVSKMNAYLGRGYVKHYAGDMDEVAIFNRALSEKEVQLLFEQGKRGYSLAGR